MSFRYVNPGYAELLVESDYFTPNVPASTVLNNTYSKCGVSFTCLNGDFTNVRIPVRERFVDNLYMKFDVFFGVSSNIRATVYIGNVVNNLAWTYGFMCDRGDCCFRHRGDKYGKKQALNFNSINTIWFHIYTDGTDNTTNNSYFEMIINGNEKITTHFAQAAVFSDKYVLMSVVNELYFSNIIVSDEYIDPKEEIVILPTSGVVTDMTANQDGTYTADTAGQTILQTVDATSLITRYGGKSRVTCIASVGIPAYKSAAGLSNLVGIDKISGTITEHDTIALSTNSTVGAVDCWNTNMTIANLNGKQIGWKVAT